MISLVDYQSSDEENEDINNAFDDKYVNKDHCEKKSETISNEKRNNILKKLIKNQKSHELKVNFIDENFYMNLESESVNESVTSSDIVNPKPEFHVNQSSSFNIPEPKLFKSVTPIDFNSDFLDVDYDEESDLTDPSSFNLNLIKPDEEEEIPADYLRSGGLLTVSEQANLKRKYNVDIGTIVAKKVCMDDLTADRPRDIKPTLTADEIARFKSIKEEQPDKNSSRQHQITWLAHKAKEKEFELMNSLSENTFSQKQARGKYGF